MKRTTLPLPVLIAWVRIRPVARIGPIFMIVLPHALAKYPRSDFHNRMEFIGPVGARLP
jgi:hypothetical protein